MGTLYLVATPIGNLEDVTLRALRVLSEVSTIAAEDTRTTRKLLSHHDIPAPSLVSYTDRSRRQRTPQLLDALQEGDVALVSEAGMPGISDPGVHLVEAAVETGHRVVPVPGASAVIAALAVSGLSTRQFHYLGFLPRAAGARRKLLRRVAQIDATLVAFEAPHRLRAALADMLGELGDRRIAVCRELTKLHEEVLRARISEATDHFGDPRGEFTLVIEGSGAPPDTSGQSEEIDAALEELRHKGLRAREAVREAVRRTGASRQTVYKRWLALAGENSDTPSVS